MVLGITYRVKSQFLLSKLVDVVFVKAESSGSTLCGEGIPIENYAVDKLSFSRLKAYCYYPPGLCGQSLHRGVHCTDCSGEECPFRADILSESEERIVPSLSRITDRPDSPSSVHPQNSGHGFSVVSDRTLNKHLTRLARVAFNQFGFLNHKPSTIRAHRISYLPSDYTQSSDTNCRSDNSQTSKNPIGSICRGDSSLQILFGMRLVVSVFLCVLGIVFVYFGNSNRLCVGAGFFCCVLGLPGLVVPVHREWFLCYGQ